MDNPLFRESAPLSEVDQLLVELYRQCGMSVDQLPYTDTFESIYKRLQQTGDQRSRHDIYQRLLNLRKAGRLPRVA